MHGSLRRPTMPEHGIRGVDLIQGAQTQQGGDSRRTGSEAGSQDCPAQLRQGASIGQAHLGEERSTTRTGREVCRSLKTAGWKSRVRAESLTCTPAACNCVSSSCRSPARFSSIPARSMRSGIDLIVIRDAAGSCQSRQRGLPVAAPTVVAVKSLEACRGMKHIRAFVKSSLQLDNSLGATPGTHPGRPHLRPCSRLLNTVQPVGHSPCAPRLGSAPRTRFRTRSPP